MLAVRGYYDGDCVRLLEPLNVKKNQAVIVKVVETHTMRAAIDREASDPFLAALKDDRFVIPTKINVEKYMKELRENDRV